MYTIQKEENILLPCKYQNSSWIEYFPENISDQRRSNEKSFLNTYLIFKFWKVQDNLY